MQADGLAGSEPGLVRARLAQRDHEGEGVLELVRRQVPPPHVVGIVAAPARRLVGLIAEHARGAALLDRLLVNAGHTAAGEHDAAANVLAGVVLLRRTGADVDEIGRHVGVIAVVGERHPHLAVVGDGLAARRDLG